MASTLMILSEWCSVTIQEGITKLQNMVFGNIVPSHLNALSLEQALELSNIYLENAYRTTDNDIALVLCHETKVALSQAKSANKKYPAHPNDVKHQGLRKRMAAAYIDLSKLLERRGHQGEARAIFRKRQTITKRTFTVDTPVDSMNQRRQGRDIASVASYIFPNNVRSPSIEFKLLEADERLTSTPQLACCLALLQASLSPDEILDPATLNWLRMIENDPDEQERLKTMTTEVIRTYMRDELKDTKAVNEVGAGPGYLDADDLVKILELVSTRLQDTHQQSTDRMRQLTMSHVLDAMADSKVKDLDREKIHEPLSTYLGGLKESKDPYLVHQAAYAYQDGV
ncbi:hypothetical protein BGX34_008952 [Mortierella sp. NVP85]|nr:hypothetical protein BGX34_008952 [Mortierella sp. NVP85]